MRPLKLELEGFSAFRERTEVDFADTELFVLTGATGSGKSSLIDAMTFALYGSVPRYDDKRLVAPVITQGKNEARVRLDFALGQTEYTAVRVVRRTASGATTKETRLERGKEVLADNPDAVSEEVARLLGLDFDQFTRCVVLPQGDFAEFLHDKPANRQKLLTRLLGIDLYQKIREGAVAREMAAKSNAQAYAQQLQDLAESTPQALKDVAKRIEKLDGLKKTVEEAVPDLEKLESEQKQLSDDRATLAKAIERLEDLEIPDGIAELGKLLEAATEAEAKATAAESKAEQAVDAARKALAALGNSDTLKAAERAHAELAKNQSELTKVEAVAAKSAKEAKAASAGVAEARKAVESARAAVEAAQKDELAQHLAHGLSEGEACPVCLQTVTRLPRHPAPVTVMKAKKGLESATKALQAAESTDQKAMTADVKARSSVDQLKKTVAGLTETLKSAPSPEDIQKTLRAIEAAAKTVEAADAQFKAARGHSSLAREGVKKARTQQSRAQAAFDAARDSVAGLEPPPADREDLAGSWGTLVEWAGTQSAAMGKKLTALDKKIETLGGKQEKLLEKLEKACNTLDVSFDEDSPRDGVVEALAQERARHERIEADLKRGETLRKQAEKAIADQRIAGELAKHLKSTGFERWLMAEAMDRLVEHASKVLEEISGGQYSFARADNNNFEIVDHRNANETRPVRTLSGGETFLASLALALTLVDHVAEMASAGSARLESIFLDEGFGSLDPHTLGEVATIIEDLASGDRVVGIVTHVRELADRIPVQYRVTKGPSTASVERVVS